ncbi:DEAD/DEAH box helicase family protein [Candidatus Woesearchaeota archaeon]|nr:DEAD/DEAH box helicase family protein [Candidatus Woesearchaeota archaeon]
MIEAVRLEDIESIENLNNKHIIQKKYMLKDIIPRLYQETILSTCVNNNCLVVLPTGMGKTMIALMLASQRFRQYPESKMLFIAPTKPLVEQHLQTFKSHFDINEGELAVFTGLIRPEKRHEMWKKAKIVFSTPQGLENDIISDRIDIGDVSLLVVDEAHRAVGDYSYVFLAKQYNKKAKHPKILALTASPGSDLEKIREVCKNLYIEEVEIRTDDDPDVKPYVQEMDIKWVKVNLPEEFIVVKKYLEASFKSKLAEMKKYGSVNTSALSNFGKKDLLDLQRSLHAKISQGEKDFETLKSLSLTAEAIKVQHALELIETQGANSLKKYLDKLTSESATTKVKAVQNLMRDINIKSAIIKTDSLIENGIEHPKLAELNRIVKEEVNENNKTKIIIFTQYRDSASKIKQELDKINVLSEIFVGQAKKGETGLTQKEQIAMLQMFRDGMFNVLIATSVAEEGLDIPRVDLVLFYEPIPSAIRHIQRRGRTGRQEKGRVMILMTEQTRDVGYRWSAFYKEKRMYRTLEDLRGKLKLELKPRGQTGLDKYAQEEENIKVFVDYREKGSGVVKELVDSGASVKLEKLEAADFLLSSRVGVEYKTVSDFVGSIIDGRLLQQIKELKRNFERPLIIIEGIEDIYSVRKVHPNAIRGMLATITISYGIPVLYTKNSKETASLLSVIARREQETTGKDFNLHGDRKPLTLKEQQEYIVSSLPNVGPGLAKELLRELGSVRKIINSNEEELKKVDKVGDKIAKRIRDVVDQDYL